MRRLPDFDALSLDVGGVLVVPDHGMLAGALDAAGVPHDRSRFDVGHYEAIAAVDRAASDAEDFTDYLWGFVRAVGVPPEVEEVAHAALDAVLATPVWCQPVPGSRAGLAALDAAGVPMAITSNSDGRVEDLLRRHEIVQCGPGPGVSVACVTDSGVLGVAKPHPAIFEATAERLGLEPARVLHVGDSAHYDVEGARAAGMPAIHFDPHRLCPSDAHPHVRALSDLVPHA